MTIYHDLGQYQARVKLGIEQDHDTLRDYLPYMAGLGTAALTGPLLYKHLRKVTPSTNEMINALRAQAGEQYTRVIPNKPAKSRIGRALDELLYTGGDPVVYGDVPLNTGTPGKKVPGVVRYTEPAERSLVRGDVETGGAPEHEELIKRISNDKFEEYKFWRKYVPEAFGRSENIADVLHNLGHKPGTPITSEQEGALLHRLNTHLKENYPKGFLLKDTAGLQSAGVFPDEKSKFNTLLQRYRQAGLHDRYTRGVANLDKDHGGDIGDLIAQLRVHPAYGGRVLDQILKDPTKVMVQEKLPLGETTSKLRRGFSKSLGFKPTRETRVHVEHGVAIPELTVPRYDATMEFLDQDHLRGATQYAQSIVDKLPPEHRNMSWAMDVVPLQGGGYNLIESNPGGESGFLSPETLPLSGIQLRKAYMGNYAKPVSRLAAGLGATGTGVSAGLATAALTPPDAQPSTRQIPHV